MDPAETLRRVIRLIETQQYREAQDRLSDYIGWRESGGFEPHWEQSSAPLCTISGDQLKNVLFLAIVAGLRQTRQG